MAEDIKKLSNNSDDIDIDALLGDDEDFDSALEEQSDAEELNDLSDESFDDVSDEDFDDFEDEASATDDVEPEFDDSLVAPEEQSSEEETASSAETGITESDASDDSTSEDSTSEDEYENHLPGEIEMDSKTTAEFDSTFSGEEQLEMLFNGIKGKFRTEMKTIPVDSIMLPRMKKDARKRTIIGLTGLVSTLSGVITPIHVMTLEDSDDEYMLLDGSRRLYSAIKSGLTEINAVIWDFDNKDEGKALANILSLVLNRSQQFKNEELWSTLRVLETVNNCTPGKIEYLLQMQSGDAMKLKDIMLAEGDDDVAELKEKFMNDEISIESAYKKLNSIRKKENRLERDEEREIDLNQDASVMGTDTEALTEAGGSGGSDEPRPRLSRDEVLELLEMGTEDVTDQSIADLKAKGDALREEANQPEVQDVNNRHPVDPEIKRKTFERDGYKCVCCGTGDELYLSILVFHHKIPVFAGGPDTVDNGLTLCANCHLMIHNFADGHLHGDIDAYDEQTQQTLKNIMKYGLLIIKAAKQLGLKRADVHKLDASSRKHIMPNMNVKANNEAFAKSSSDFDRGLEEGDSE